MIDDLTPRDWAHIRRIARQQRKEYEPEDDETPSEDVMTSIGYVLVSYDPSTDQGTVEAFGDYQEFDLDAKD